MFCTKLWYWLPGLSLGLFGGRLLSELAASQWGALFWPGATAITLLCAGAVLGGLATGRLTFYSTQTAWPLLLLWLYLLHPHLDWQRVGLVLLLTWLAGLLNSLPRRLRFNDSPHWPAATLGRAAVLAYAGPRPAAGRQRRIPTGGRHAGRGPSARLSPLYPAGPPVYPAARPDARLWPESVCRADQQPDALSGLPDRLPADTAPFGRACITAVLTLATATTFWSQATVANVRSLTALFAAFVIYHLIRFYQTRDESVETADYHLLWAALGLGFGLTHHASLLFMGLVFGLALLVFDPTFIRQPRRWLRPHSGRIGRAAALALPALAGLGRRARCGRAGHLVGLLGPCAGAGL
jgi:hypothetical protein